MSSPADASKHTDLGETIDGTPWQNVKASQYDNAFNRVSPGQKTMDGVSPEPPSLRLQNTCDTKEKYRSQPRELMLPGQSTKNSPTNTDTTEHIPVAPFRKTNSPKNKDQSRQLNSMLQGHSLQDDGETLEARASNRSMKSIGSRKSSAFPLSYNESPSGEPSGFGGDASSGWCAQVCFTKPKKPMGRIMSKQKKTCWGSCFEEGSCGFAIIRGDNTIGADITWE